MARHGLGRRWRAGVILAIGVRLRAPVDGIEVTTSGSSRLFSAWSIAANRARDPRRSMGIEKARPASLLHTPHVTDSGAVPSGRVTSNTPSRSHRYSYMATALLILSHPTSHPDAIPARACENGHYVRALAWRAGCTRAYGRLHESVGRRPDAVQCMFWINYIRFRHTWRTQAGRSRVLAGDRGRRRAPLGATGRRPARSSGSTTSAHAPAAATIFERYRFTPDRVTHIARRVVPEGLRPHPDLGTGPPAGGRRDNG